MSKMRYIGKAQMSQNVRNFIKKHRDDIDEITEVFSIPVSNKSKSEVSNIDIEKWLNDVKMELSDLSYDNTRISELEKRSFEPKSCDEKIITELWNAKSKLDFLFDTNISKRYYSFRNEIFKYDQVEDNRFFNRAGYKLFELLEELDIIDIDSDEKVEFVDLCGGPGAFSQVLLDFTKGENRGYGVTLRSKNCWRSELLKDKRFTTVWGDTNDGDILKEENLLHLRDKIENDQVPIKYVVADGGFNVDLEEWLEGEKIHIDNLKEVYSGSLIIAELYGALITLQEDGYFICKLFDSFTYLTISVIFVVALLFEEVYIVKPKTSRIVNSEKYLVGKSLKPSSYKYIQVITKLVEGMYRKCEKEKYFTPKSIIPMDIMKCDKMFWNTIVDLNETLATKQTKGINLVIDSIMLQDRNRNYFYQKVSDYNEVLEKRKHLLNKYVKNNTRLIKRIESLKEYINK